MLHPLALQRWLFLGSLAGCLSQSISAQIVINEFSAANKSQHMDNFGEYEDWIELYNAGASPVNLQGYHLSDELANPLQYTFPNITIPANGRLMVYASNRDMIAGASVHANFKLTQMRQESVVLSDPSGNILDSYTIVSPMQRNHSFGRSTDGGGTWKVMPNPTPNASNNSAVKFDRYADKPVFSQQAGSYAGSITVSITAEAGATIRYTTNGTPPSATSPIYSAPITVGNTQIIRARAFSSDPNVYPSFAENNTYIINETFTFPIVSIASDDYTDLFNSSMDEIVTTFEYFENGQFVLETEGDMRGHGNDSWAFPQKGMRFYVRDQYGYSNKMDHQFFPTSPRTDFDVVLLKAAGSDNYPSTWGLQSCHLRDAYAQTLAEKYELNVDVRRLRHIVVFLNGQYHGVYEMRERVDSDYTDYYYDQPEAYVDMLKFWGWLNVEYGSANDWDALDNYMDNNPMTVQANYDYVKTQLDPMSLIDYFMINTYTANSDWLNWNTAWWRGRKAPGLRWKYWLWDMDNTFDLGQNYTGIGTTTYNNSPCDAEDLFPNDPDIEHTDMFAQLLENEEFFDLYVNRYADLLNTAFHCDSMLAHFDAMVAALTPEMPRQIARWGGTMTEWQNNLAHMRGQIQGRCAVIEQSFVNCYTPEITMPQNVVVDVSPAGAGNVRINTVTPNNYPWTGAYFGGVNLSFKATANAGYVFDHWQVTNASALPNTTNDSMYIQFNAADNIVAVFVPAISIAGSTTNDDCNGTGVGSITTSPTGGVPPFSFVWNTGATTQNLNNVIAGTYGVTMTDANGTTISQSFTVNANAAPVVSLANTAPLCAAGSDGSINASVTGGAAPYSFAWSNSATTEDLSGLAAGSYTLVVTDAAACTVSSTTTLNDGNSPTAVALATDVRCNGGSDGSVNATISGGTSPYSFAWSTGATTEDLGAVATGSYSLVVTDANGCTASANATVNQPTALTLALDITHATSGDNGSIAAQVSGGTNPYSYLWDDPNAQTSATAINLAAGVYEVLVQDANGCSALASGEILAGSIDCVKPTMTITPNGDGVNDTWVLDCMMSFENEVSVYNRWGQVVFTATNYDGSWDGDNLTDGGYFFLITVTTPQDSEKVLKGALNIIR